MKIKLFVLATVLFISVLFVAMFLSREPLDPYSYMMGVPGDATDKVDLGNYWYKFTLDGHRYLYHHGSMPILKEIPLNE